MPKTDTTQPLTLSAGRDYRFGALTSDHEFCLYRGDDIVARRGGFKSAAAARRAGIRHAQTMMEG